MAFVDVRQGLLYSVWLRDCSLSLGGSGGKGGVVMKRLGKGGGHWRGGTEHSTLR